jgi:histidinol-phosphatase (PHP family)
VIDLHVHSTHSGDAESSIFEMCRRAVDIGLSEIGFAEHLDTDPSDLCYQYLKYDAYMQDIEKARREFRRDLLIHAGVECDYQVRFHDDIARWLEGKHLDYKIGSAHYVGGLLIQDHEDFFTGKTALEAYIPYFDVVQAVVDSGLFDILGHMDLCKRKGAKYFPEFPAEALRDRFINLLNKVIDSEMVLEVNTSGLRQAPNDTYPSLETVRMYLALGGKKITVGSDSHCASDLAKGIPETVQNLTSLGIKHIGI